eukprot:297621_1
MKRKFPTSSDDDRSRKRQRLNNYGYDSNKNNNSNNQNNQNGFDDHKYSASPSLSIRPTDFEADLDKLQRPEMLIEPEYINNNGECTKELRFQHVDTDYYIGYAPNETMQRKSRNSRAIIRLYGITSDGHSVLCHVIGFCPYFYVETWDGFMQNRD